ncbi:metabolite traffic protein EboE [Pseudomonas mosselii]|uniref:metabolite traffic protein EboE n=1 Tax=Pseudomonas mosselii TaxID=78327 RepID=UPI0021D8CAFB|nr:metabolite traffic protein EboE [Pseudomonas mosselii]MCU9529522.1 metabolite traffic protein EboE [Pseudomonas mosselii]MCU9536822.1 metabolite traffic protein EboE [Pseudomonas mosselii]MCU9543145.1 metabolite traffic protein EboE [Pseudomonas mosselii]MCU9548425.1 metabolite traffic protein EboE [Pseudomonas mosselii]
MTLGLGWTAAQLGYCANVHPARDLPALRVAIDRHFQGVRRLRGLDQQDSGLWISAAAATELREPPKRRAFFDLLRRSGLCLTSLNGFPYGQFHEGTVKAAVYLPSWAEPQRLAYSLDLARLLAEALPSACPQGAISSVPLGYAAHWNPTLQHQAEEHLRQLTAALARLHQETGKRIVMCLEMEPDCVLQTTDQAIAFFHHWQASDPHHEYLALCFDVCHQAVMFEDCRQSLESLRQAGVPIGKIQLSNAMICRLPTDDPSRCVQVLDVLGSFAEATYLHQVQARDVRGRIQCWADLPAALAACASQPGRYPELRVHFHIPLFSEHLLLPELGGSQMALAQTFDFLAAHEDVRPVLEVETYSWGVLPAPVRPSDEQAQHRGIRDELRWVEEQLRQRRLLQPQAREVHADAL